MNAADEEGGAGGAVGGGLKDIPLIAPGFPADEDVIQAVGEPMLGVLNTAHWTHDLDIPANADFVAAFHSKYDGRYPSVHAAMAYDSLMAMDAAVRDVAGKVEDREALLQALRKPSFKSVRGDLKYGANNFPVRNYYLREVGKDAQGRLTNKLIGTTLEQHQDAYVGACIAARVHESAGSFAGAVLAGPVEVFPARA